MVSPKSVQLYLVDGTAGGLIIAEIMNWTGKILACPRSQLGSLLNRDETRGTGVYILLGEEEFDPTQQVAYIGETDDVRQRISQHNKSKDFWNRVITITNKDLNMTKAHVRYLENRLIRRARTAQRARLENGNDTTSSPLPEAATSDMEQFLDQILLIMPLLNVNIFRAQPSAMAQSVQDQVSGAKGLTSPVFELRKPNLLASAQEVDGEFVVLDGSEAMIEWRLSNSPSPLFRNRLIEDHTLIPTEDGKKLVFSRNHAFTSPSGAATVVLGRNANGRNEWRVKDTGQRYNEWQEASISIATEI